MFKYKFIFIIISYFIFQEAANTSQVDIAVKVNEEIITSYDVKKEMNILLALNNQLENIEKDKLQNIAKNSLIKETIRKLEIQRILNNKRNVNNNINPVLENLISNLNLKNEKEFNEYLKNYNISINDIIEKIKIENDWKAIIYQKYINKIEIDKKKIRNKISELKKKSFQVEFNLSEILFQIQNNNTLEQTYEEILQSINDIGFENTANIFSIADSSNTGGKIGWIKESNLSKVIEKNLIGVEVNKYTKPIKLGNNFLILKVNDLRNINIEIDEEEEMEKLIFIETSAKLERFSNIYYNKIKLNTSIQDDF
jgi:peptidyl-prolyl cis-trans isomerase SurA